MLSSRFYYIISLFFLLKPKKRKKIFFIGSAISIALAVLVKGLVGLFPLVIIGIYLSYFKSIRKNFLTKETRYAIISFFVLVLPLFFYRFIREKDFFIKAFEYHMIKRLMNLWKGISEIGHFIFHYFKMYLDLYFLC